MQTSTVTAVTRGVRAAATCSPRTTTVRPKEVPSSLAKKRLGVRVGSHETLLVQRSSWRCFFACAGFHSYAVSHGPTLENVEIGFCGTRRVLKGRLAFADHRPFFYSATLLSDSWAQRLTAFRDSTHMWSHTMRGYACRRRRAEHPLSALACAQARAQPRAGRRNANLLHY